MPRFYTGDSITIDVDEFLSECTDKEIQDAINWLAYHKKSSHRITALSNGNFLDEKWFETIKKLSNARLRLTESEDNIISKIADKF